MPWRMKVYGSSSLVAASGLARRAHVPGAQRIEGWMSCPLRPRVIKAGQFAPDARRRTWRNLRKSDEKPCFRLCGLVQR